jgi:hypothetical protein
VDYATAWTTPAAGGGGVTIGAAAPSSPSPGQLWWRNDPDGNLFIYYNDGNTSQWVPAVPTSTQWAVSGAALTPADPAKAVYIPGPTTGDYAAIRVGTRTAKGRIIADSANSHLRISMNDALGAGGWTQDDVTRPSWGAGFFCETGFDMFAVSRSAPGGAFLTDLLQISAAGELFLPSTGSLLKLGSGTVKSRHMEVGAGDFQWRINAGSVVDDASKPAWAMRLSSTADDFSIFRAAAGAGVTFSQLLALSGGGTLTVLASPLVLGSTASTGYPVYYGPRCEIISGTSAVGANATTNFDIYNNVPGTLNYDQSVAGYLLRLGVGPANDWVNIYRRPPASSSFSQQLWTVDSLGNMAIMGPTATKASGTTWANPSDIRIKKNITPYMAGLKEILELRPIQFEHNGFADTEDGRVCWGYLADDVAKVMPECVSVHTKQLANKETIDLKLLDTSNISLALVNAVRTLASRVSLLEMQ